MASPSVKLRCSPERGYSPVSVNIGRLVMALWQFSAIAGLISAVLICVGVITIRIGRTNTTLERIEEALRVTDSVRGRAPSAQPAADALASAEVTQSSKQSGQDSDAGFLTIRHLKVISQNARRDTETTGELNQQGRDALEVSCEPRDSASSPPLMYQDMPSVTSESRGAEITNDKVEALSDTCVVNEDSVPVSPESRDTASTSNELPLLALTPSVDAPGASGEGPQSSPEPCEVDPADKRKHDAWLILNSQRRRRRTRGY